MGVDWNCPQKPLNVKVEMVEVEENAQVVERPDRPYQPRALR